MASPLRSVLLSVLGATVAAATKRDVIMIAVDDMRPELNCYGKLSVHCRSPHYTMTTEQIP